MVSAPPPSPVLTAIAALPRTALMPNGAASYRGSYTVVENSMETTGNQTHRWSETSTAQLVLNANFATRSVTAGLSNLVIRSEFETSAGLGVDHNYTEFSGQSTGSGPITTTGGVVGFQANLTGTFTARRVGTSASDAVSAVGDAIFSIDDPITLSGDFRGPQAEAILGVQSLDLGTGSKITTIIASRP